MKKLFVVLVLLFMLTSSIIGSADRCPGKATSCDTYTSGLEECRAVLQRHEDDANASSSRASESNPNCGDLYSDGIYYGACGSAASNAAGCYGGS